MRDFLCVYARFFLASVDFFSLRINTPPPLPLPRNPHASDRRAAQPWRWFEKEDAVRALVRRSRGASARVDDFYNIMLERHADDERGAGRRRHWVTAASRPAGCWPTGWLSVC